MLLIVANDLPQLRMIMSIGETRSRCDALVNMTSHSMVDGRIRKCSAPGDHFSVLVPQPRIQVGVDE